MPLILTAVALEFVTVTEWAGLVALITVAGISRVLSENVRGPADPPVPVPERLTTCGLNMPLYVTVTPPRTVPGAVGVNETLKVHLDAPASVAPQGIVPLATALKSPLATSVKLSEEEPLFFSVTVREGLVVPTATLPKAIADVEIEIGGSPVPLRFSSDGVVGRELLTVTSPGIEPMRGGLKVTVILQLPLGCSVAPAQVLVWA
jgi:hypothetical protein